MNEEESRHKHRKSLQEISKGPFETPGDAGKGRDFRISRARCPPIASLVTGGVRDDNDLDQTQRATRYRIASSKFMRRYPLARLPVTTVLVLPAALEVGR